MTPNYIDLGLSSPMSVELRKLVEEQLIVDLKYYDVKSDNLKFDWSNSCIEGHLSNHLNSSLENYSEIYVYDNSNNLIAEGWMDYINSSEYLDKSTFFITYWDNVIIWNNKEKLFEKLEFGIPNHIWEKIPENLKKFLKNDKLKKIQLDNY